MKNSNFTNTYLAQSEKLKLQELQTLSPKSLKQDGNEK